LTKDERKSVKEGRLSQEGNGTKRGGMGGGKKGWFMGNGNFRNSCLGERNSLGGETKGKGRTSILLWREGVRQNCRFGGGREEERPEIAFGIEGNGTEHGHGGP